ncbi:MAG: hypothetical protein EPO24_00840 [Bacteroidetes bacterium]|nr:MAG: hypothetical protein EPO24_00840 [Bacteroidota bacterium]
MKRQPESSTATQRSTVREGKRELFLGGHETNFYYSQDPDYLIQEFTANGNSNGKRSSKKLVVPALRSGISCYLFEHIDGFHIPTHFVKRLSDTEMMVRKLEMIPVSVRAYNFSVGSIPERFGIAAGSQLEFPVFEYYLHASNQQVTWVNEHHLYALGIATPDECKQINRLTSKINAVLRALCLRRKLALVEMQLEFGRYKGQIYLGDDLSPRTCRFGDASTENGVDVNKYSPKGDDAEAVYTELLNRLSLKI